MVIDPGPGGSRGKDCSHRTSGDAQKSATSTNWLILTKSPLNCSPKAVFAALMDGGLYSHDKIGI